MDEYRVVAIDEELKKQHKTQAEKKVILANLFTLIIYVHEEKRAAYLRNIIQNVIEKYPCRIIFIQVDTTPDHSFLQTGVNSVQNTKDGALIACDQITIDVGGKYLERVPSLILPHVITDLPVYLLWGQDTTCSSDMLSHLEKLADRLIFDAECTNDLWQFSQAILKKNEALTIDLVDINWVLSGGWRDVITQAFDSREHLDQLKKSEKIFITYNSQHSDWMRQPEMQSIYIQAWIASRLKWQYQSMVVETDKRTITYVTGTGVVDVTLMPESTANQLPGSILSFEVYSTEGYHFLLEQSPVPSKVTVNCSSQQLCELPYTLQLLNIKRGSTFMNEIFYSAPSQHYLEALELLTRIRQP